MARSSSNALDPLLCSAARSLFDALVLPVTSVEERSDEPQGPQLAASIGFVNEKMSGSLTVTATRRVVTAMRPEDMRSEGADDAILLDVIAEVANMLLGRMKTLLARRGVAVLLSTPTASIAERMRFWSPPTEGARWHSFLTAEGPVFARVALSIAPSVVLDGTCDADDQPVGEGELLML